MAYLCGNAGYVEVGGVRLDVTAWNATEQAKLTETTNTASLGFKESLVCLKWMTGTINADFDAALGPKGAPSIDAGDTIALILHTDASGTYTMSAIVQDLAWTQPAGDKVSFTFNFESNGAYLYA